MSEVAEFDVTKPYCGLSVQEAMEFYDWLEQLTPPAKASGGRISRGRFLGIATAILKHAEAEVGFIEGAVMEAKKVDATKRDILRE